MPYLVLLILCLRPNLIWRSGSRLSHGKSATISFAVLNMISVGWVVMQKAIWSDRDIISFNICLQYNPGAGTSNGIHRRQRYFKCKNDSAVFCGLHRIRRYILPRRQGAIQSRDTTAVEENLYGLKKGDRIVWLSDLGPVNGTVKWIGFLPYQKNRRAERKEDVTVGVDFVSIYGHTGM